MSVVPELLALVAPSADYTLWKRFTMPTHDGPRSAIAVTLESSKVLQSLYALMLKMIVIQVWYLVVLIGIALSARPNKPRSHNISIANVIIWNAQSSPLDIVKLMFGYIAHISLYAIIWAFLAALAWGASIAFSLLISPELIIGFAAPVSSEAIYVPEFSPIQNQSSYSLRLNSISTSANLRAIGAADNVTSNSNVNVGKPIITTSAFGESIYTINYSYSVSDVDFGLQNTTGLLLTVNGSCFTDYTAYAGADNKTDFPTDVYVLFASNHTAHVSTIDGGPPLATFIIDPADPGTPFGSNISYAITISSLGRKSYTPGTDPWYTTVQLKDDALGAGYIVTQGRPVLNCWQTDIWSYQGKRQSINNLGQLGALSPSFVMTFQRFLSTPRIINLAQSLGTTALKSATGSLGRYFDAQSSNLHDDLQRLVLGAYIATRDMLQETTRFSRQYSDISNLMHGGDGNLLPGADRFVIYTGDAAALSVPMLISVPIVAALLLGLVFLLTTSFPCYAIPWGYVEALRAAVIYSALDNDPKNDHWDRRTPAPIFKPNPNAQGVVHEAHVRPKFERKEWSWYRSEHGSDGTSIATPTTEKKIQEAEIAHSPAAVDESPASK
ncbi:hypothetical protein B0J14DRAFT_234982 [Halenospora varia]|nr:hypothetical protein B0J14DRAFT_234982 [Halenospora varia]